MPLAWTTASSQARQAQCLLRGREDNPFLVLSISHRVQASPLHVSKQTESMHVPVCRSYTTMLSPRPSRSYSMPFSTMDLSLPAVLPALRTAYAVSPSVPDARTC